MGAKTKTVGGSQLGGQVANGWNQFLLGQINQANSNNNQPGQQTSAFGNAFNTAMSGGTNDPSGANAAIQNWFKNPTQYGNQYTAPTMQTFDPSMLPTNFGQGQTGMADLSQFGPNAAQSTFNTQAPLRNVGSGYDPSTTALFGKGMSMLNNGNGGFSAASAGPDVNMTPQMDYNTAYNTVGQDPLLDRNKQKAIADMRARFGAEGAGALGTGAQYAESNLNAELAAQDASMRRNQAMQLMNQDLQGNRSLADVGLQNKNINSNVSTANMQGGLQGNNNMTSMFNSMANNLVGARGQDLSTGLGMRGQDLSQLGMGAEQAMGNAGMQNSWASNLMNSMINNQGMGNSFGINAANLNNSAVNSNNSALFNNANMANNFNLSNASNNANFGQAANGLNANMFNNMIGNGLNLNQLGNGNMMAMLQNMMQGFGQNNSLNTAQAQTIQQSNPWGQIANTALGIGGTLLGGPLGGMIGSKLGGMFGLGGGGMSGLPTGAMNLPHVTPMTTSTGYANPIGSYMPTLSFGR